jgi:hypothetical protein
LWDGIFMQPFRTSFILAGSLNRLATQSLLWSPNQRMSLLHLISGLFPVVMLFTKCWPRF